MPGPSGSATATDLLRLTEEQFAHLRAMTQAAEPEPGEDRHARAVRLAGSHLGTVVVSMAPAPGLDVVPFRVRTLNVSRTGLAFLHGAAAFAGTPCVIAVEARAGGQRVIHARVVRCRKLEGRAHEVGVRFDAPVDVAELIAYEPGRSEPPTHA